MDAFLTGYIYRRGTEDNIYLCYEKGPVALFQEFEKQNNAYIPTTNKYFLSRYAGEANSFKNRFLRPMDYECIGKIGVNYNITNDLVITKAESKAEIN